jgi:hypothetical protein
MSWKDINSNDRGNILGNRNPWQTNPYGQNTTTPMTPTNPANPTQPGTGTPPANWQDWYSQYGGQYPGWTGNNPTQPQAPTQTGVQPTFTQPTTTMSVEDFSNWLQENLATGAYNTSGTYQANMNEAMEAQQGAYNNYSSGVSGLQGVLQSLYGNAQDALSGYNDFDWNTILSTGQVPEATRNYYQQIRDNTVANLQSDLTKQFNEQFGPLKEQLAASGTWDSTLGSRAVGDLMGEKARLLAQGSNTANAQMAQNLINAPYLMLQGAGTNLSNMLSGLSSQSNLASAILPYMSNQFAMSGDMADLSQQNFDTYLNPLMTMYSNLLNAETARTIAQEQSNAAADAASAGNDAAMWSAIGGLLGGLF